MEPQGAQWCKWRVVAQVKHRVKLGGSALLLLALSLFAAPSVGATEPWANLRRPLHIPHLAAGSKCPVSKVNPRDFGGAGIGQGPVDPGLAAHSGLLMATRDKQYGGPWFGDKVFWYVQPTYRGPVLIRGRRLDGPQIVRFNGQKRPPAELRIEAGETVTWQGQPPGSRGIASTVRVIAPGCYGFQIDGTTFSRVVIFIVDVAR